MTETAPPVGVTLAAGRRAVLEEWAWRLAPVWATLGALALNLFLLGRRSLVADEAQAVAAVTGTWGDLWAELQATEATDALFDVLLKPWLAFAGSDEWALRFPSAVAGAVAVGLTCALGGRLLGRVAGLVAAGALATGIATVEWSQRADGSSLAVAAVVAATLALVWALERPVWWRWLLWCLATVAAVAISLLAVSVVIAHVATFVVYRPRVDRRAPAVALTAVLAVALASSALVLVSDVQLDSVSLPAGSETAEGLWHLIGLTPVPLAVAALGLYALVAERVVGAATWKAVLLGAWLAAPVLVGLLAALTRPAFDAGYALTAAPALALLVAAGVVSQQRWIAVGLIVLLVAGAGLRFTLWHIGPGGEDWRGAVREIRAGKQAGDAVVVIPERQRVAVEYYAGEGVVADRARGDRVWLLLAQDDEERRLVLARKLVRPPRYALRDEHEYGDGLWLQTWDVP